MVSGVGDPMKMAGGIGEALVCTASGLVVAIPAYVLHRYFRSKVQGYVVQMEKQATALLDELSATRPQAVDTRAATASAAPPRPARLAG
jgi:biopolymer transport protein ExbB